MPEILVRRYCTVGGPEPFTEWLAKLKAYFGREGTAVVILLCGGDKRKQDADIKRAIDLWREYEERRNRGSIASR